MKQLTPGIQNPATPLQGSREFTELIGEHIQTIRRKRHVEENDNMFAHQHWPTDKSQSRQETVYFSPTVAITIFYFFVLMFAEAFENSQSLLGNKARRLFTHTAL